MRAPFLLAVAAGSLTAAQAQIDPVLVQDFNNRIANASATVLEVFSSANTISTGDFHYDNPGPDDVDFSTFKLPLDYKFGAATNRLRPLIEGYYGYFKLTEDVTGLGPPTGVFRIHGHTVSAGGGVEWRVADGLDLTPRLLLAYSHLRQDYHRDSLPGDPYANIIANWHADLLTLSPSLEARGSWSWDRWDFQMKSRYTFLQLFDSHDNSGYIELNSQTHVWKNEVGVSYRSTWAIFQLPLRPFAQFARYDLHGDIIQTELVDFFYEARFGVGVTMPRVLAPISEVVLSSAYYFQGPLTGCSVGVSLSF